MDKATWQAKIREQLTHSTHLFQRMAPGLTHGALATAAPRCYSKRRSIRVYLSLCNCGQPT